MTRTYGLLDLVPLAARLLAPVVDAIRAEFATCMDRKSTPTPPSPATRITPGVTEVPTAAACVVEMITRRPAGEKAGIPVESAVVQSTGIPAVLGIPTTPPSEAGIPATASDAGIPATAPLYVRVGAGRGARYRQASDLHPAGQRFRKRVANGRVKYELAR